MIRLLAGLLFALTLIAPRSATASEAVEALLLEAPNPAALRARLLEFAAGAPDSAIGGKGAALYYAGLSFHRDGRADSALICFERAVAVRGAAAERDAMVDGLLHRAQTGDAALALEVLAPRLKVALTTSERDIAATQGRRAWAMFAQNQADSALALMRSFERWLLDEATPLHRDWRYRLGLLELEHGQAPKSIELLLPLAIESRFQDRDVMGILRDASRKTPEGAQLASLMKQELLGLDNEERKILEAIGARRVTFAADDGAAVGAVAFPGAGAGVKRAVIAVKDPDEPFDAYDSLAAGLARSGYAVLVMDPRGSGWSVSPTWPLPTTWSGREAEMHHRVARDIPSALRALATLAKVDTTRFLLIGSLAGASIAVEGATLDRRARPLVILSPNPSPVDRGAMLARAKELRTPIFFEVPAFDHGTLALAEALYAATDPRQSRLAESEIIGSAARVFRRDISALPRLLRWLDESWVAGGKAGRKR